MPLPPAPFIGEFDPLRAESNEEFTARLKNMGKSNKWAITWYIYKDYYFCIDSMEKFNQLARRFSMRKDTPTNMARYSKQPM